MKLSVAIICKNEADVIERCLQSVMTADEIVVVDTGSDDSTKVIASKYATKVLDFAWCDDFSKARNFAIENCTGDWILILDADEWIEDMSQVRWLTGLEGDHDSITMTVYYNNKKSHNHIRIIKPTVRYVMPVHEYPAAQKTLHSEVKIQHLKGTSHGKDLGRNLRLLIKAVDDNPNMPRYKFYLACEYYWKNDLITALYWFQEYVKNSAFVNEKSDAFLFIAKIFWRLQRGDEAREACLKAILLNPNFKEAFLKMAEMSWEHQAGQWRKLAEVADNTGVLFHRT